MSNKLKIEIEKKQMMDWWGKQINNAQGRCMIKSQSLKIKKICNLAAPENMKSELELAQEPRMGLGMSLRKLHDKWGYCAAYEILCAGAVYRTKAFMDIDSSVRKGTKLKRGEKYHGHVHIEHTVPVKSLSKQLKLKSHLGMLKEVDMFGWLLRHSVTCAFARGEEGFRNGYGSKTDVFTDEHADKNKPFARYTHLISPNVEVWNIWTGEQVDIKNFTFDDHVETLKKIFINLNASPAMLESLG